MLVQRLQGAGITALGDEHAQHALVWYPEDLDKAYDLLVLANESFEGELKDYNPDVTMVGAINRNMVTCYLDALLFAMFARLDSFEAMLYDEFSDEPRKQLAGILRLWVNLLRTGQLIKVELTKHLQDALAKCGWEEAAQICQQDASEAFTFITGALELPLLTLKMDIYHTGHEDKEDDHKFVNERLLEVAIPDPEVAGEAGVTLEDCLETYFNNRIEVKRYLQRQNTMTSMLSVEKDHEKNQTVHIETVELSGSDTPMVQTPISLGPPSPSFSQAPAPPSSVRPIQGRRRGDSIFAEKYTARAKPGETFDEKRLLDEILNYSSSGRPRSASLMRKEIMMPAWQFFSLIPWYTDNVPKTDAQVAAHFSAKRPVLGICLKRYMMLMDGTPKRLDTFVDIPLEIGFPSFISDERMEEEGPLFGNFKLVLQSVVCHRGVSINSGHYVSLVRANKSSVQGRPSSSHSDTDDAADSWLRFDDLANPRVVKVDIHKALREESPYLLFFQVQPINEDLASRGDPPSYAEAQLINPIAETSRETLASETTIDTETETETEVGGEWEKVSTVEANPSAAASEVIGRSSTSSIRRESFDLTGSVNSLTRGRTDPSTPEDQKASFLSASRRNSRVWLPGGNHNKSRPGSQSGENRLSITLSRLTGRGSKEKLHIVDNGPLDDPLIIINEGQRVQSAENGQEKSPQKEKKDGGILRSKSKKEKKEERKRLRSKSREPPNGMAMKGKHKEKERPDRECVVM
ncbi:cysteine proteinase [Lentithecium fluviatile CBS 122367]|uniref:ubiquitinyl hydrolase 1 n=1 Tax=Lentithecium fluviatile CBS 122367 TaxID=1168545 RepID=A0A6G1IMV1_9PLEO|nr:cysteine proteinase [Lentithecium fluviatile CBS 122367]